MKHSFVMLAVTFAMLCPALALSQDSTSAQSNGSATYKLGWDGSLISDAMNPLVVTIKGGDEIDHGMIIVTSGNRNSTSARVLVPFVATPGLSSRIEVSFPIGLAETYSWGYDKRWVGIEVRGERLKDSIRFSYDQTVTSVRLKSPPSSRELFTVVSAGESSATVMSAVVEQNFDPSAVTFYEDEDADSRDDIRVIQMSDLELPTRLASYEGIDAIVLTDRAVDELEPRTAETILQWVHRGGRLLLVPGSATNSLSAWGIAGELEWELGSAGAARVTVREPFARLWTMQEIELVRTAAPDGTPSSEDTGISKDTSIYQATLLTKLAGFGQISVLPSDPIHSGLSVAELPIVWSDIFDGLAPSIRPWSATNNNSNYYGYYSQDAALSYIAMDRATTQLDSIDWFPFWIIAVFIGVLGLLVGPGDALLLRKLRRRQFSWATALFWILIAGVAASVIPDLVRLGDSQVGRFVVLDAQSGNPTALRTGSTSIFSASAIDAKIHDADPEAIWRSLPSQAGAGNRNFVTSAPATYLQPASQIPQSLPIPTWSLKTLTEEGTAPNPFSGVAKQLDSERFSVRVDGLVHTDVQGSFFLFEGATYDVESIDEGDAPDQTVFTISTENDRMNFPSHLNNRWSGQYQQRGAMGGAGVPGVPGMLCTLTGGALRRSGVLEQRSSQGQAVIGFLVDTLPSMMTLENDNISMTQRTLVRLVVPLADATEASQ